MANRNRMQISAQLFGKLIGIAEQGGVSIGEQGRWIRRLNEADAELMSKADCEPLILSRQTKALTLIHNDKQYYTSFGFPPCEEPVAALVPIEATPALFVLAVLELEIQPFGTAAQIREIIQDQHAGVSGYDGHSLGDIASLFPSIAFHEVQAGFAISHSPTRLTGSYAARSYASGALMLDKSTRDSISDLFESGNDFIPFDLVLQGTLAFSWQSFFLELYRCLEQIYSVPKVEELSREFSLKNSFYDIAMTLERLLSWRPKEDEALIKVLKYCSKHHLDAVLAALRCEACTEYDQAAEVAGRAIYKLRNSLVHFRPTKEKRAIADQDWNLLITAMVGLISEAYDKIGSAFHTAQELFPNVDQGIPMDSN